MGATRPYRRGPQPEPMYRAPFCHSFLGPTVWTSQPRTPFLCRTLDRLGACTTPPLCKKQTSHIHHPTCQYITPSMHISSEERAIFGPDGAIQAGCMHHAKRDQCKRYVRRGGEFNARDAYTGGEFNIMCALGPQVLRPLLSTKTGQTRADTAGTP